MIDLRRLRVLRAVAHHESVTTAAATLHMTTSAASHQIRLLGRELGVALLQPHGRGIRLTQAAKDLLRYADDIETRWQEAYADLHRQRGAAGVVRICAISTAVSALVAPAAAVLQGAYPDLEVRISEAESDAAFELLLAEAADVAVFDATARTPPVTDRRFEQQVLLHDTFDLLVSVDHPFAGRSEVSLAEAANQDWIVEPLGISSRSYTMAACTSAGFGPRILHEVQHWDAVATLVSHRLGIAVVPRLAQLPAQLRVKRVLLRDAPIPSRVLLSAVRRGSGGHPAIAAVLLALESVSDHYAQPIAAADE